MKNLSQEATSPAAIAMGVEEWFDKYGVVILKREQRTGLKTAKREIIALQEFYPATIKAMGGPVGVLRWLNEGDTPMPERASRIFLKENHEVLERQERFEAVGQTNAVLSEFCNAS
jgi:hypothetical protein